MSYTSILHVIAGPHGSRGLVARASNTRYASPMECVYVSLVDHSEFYRLLAIHGRSGAIVGPVLCCRLYQRRADRSPEYDVWFLAVMPLRHGRNELRMRCGSQDLDQDSDNHPASREAARLHEELITHCALAGVVVREASYEEMH